MAQDRIKGEIVFICDGCDDTLETGAQDFTEANDARRESGWRAELRRGVWLHLCSQECQDTFTGMSPKEFD